MSNAFWLKEKIAVLDLLKYGTLTTIDMIAEIFKNLSSNIFISFTVFKT